MNHLMLFVYILLFSSGMIGTVATALIWRKSNKPAIGWFTVVTLLFSIWLFIHLAIFYARYILVLGFPGADAILSSINLLIGTFAYTALFIAARCLSQNKKRTLMLTAVFVPAAILNFLFIVSLIHSPLAVMMQVKPVVIIVCGYSSSALFFTGCSINFLHASGTEDISYLKLYFRWTGYLIGIYAVLIPCIGALAHLIGYQQYAGLGQYSFYFFLNLVALALLPKLKLFTAANGKTFMTGEILKKKYKITDREAEVIDLVANGMTNKEIAAALYVSLTTVRTHLYNVFRKTEVTSRTRLLKLISELKQDGSGV